MSETIQQQPQEKEPAEPFHEYKILTTANYKDCITNQQRVKMPVYFTSDEKMRAVYIDRTDKLINEITSGNYDSVIYLDKSARPIYWLVREFWDILAPGKPRPDTKFANIDAGQFFPELESRPSDEDIQDFEIPVSIINDLKKAFGNEFYKKDVNGKLILDENNQPIGKKIMIVDEISVSGSTLKLAQKILSTAFEGVYFSGEMWYQTNRVEVASRLIPYELPVWYHETDPSGRGVGDSKMSSPMFSTPLPNDPRSNELRTDIKQLAIEVKAGRQAIRPTNGDDSVYYFKDPDGKINYNKPRFKIDSAQNL